MNTSRRLFTFTAACVMFVRTMLSARASAQVSQAATPNSAGDPLSHTRQLAEAVLTASGHDARLSIINESMGIAQLWLSALQKSLPNAKPEWHPVMEQVIRDELKVWNAEITGSDIDMYAARFTDAQLADMLAFYRTEGGRALVAQTPAIIREKAELGRRLASGILPKLVVAVCAKVDCRRARGP